MQSPQREGLLDTIRAIATVRVVLWHAFASPFLSFLVASMPTMFFVAGSLLAASLDKRDHRTVIRDRARRLLIPFWVFGGFCFAVFAISRAISASPAATFRAVNIPAWILPFLDPRGTGWEGGWLSQPLWYLRAFLWLLLAAPFLRRGLLRFGNVMFVPPVLGILVVELLVRSPRLAPPGFNALRWYLGDFALYSIFLMLGFQHRRGVFQKMSTIARAEWMAIFGVAAVAWCTTQPVIGNVVNNSYPAHLLVGGAWLFAFLSLEPVLSRLPNVRVVGSIVRWLTQRSLTVYLWHSTAIVCAHTILDWVAPSAPAVAILPLVVLFVAAFGLVFGWVEDMASRRRPRVWPTPIGSLDSLVEAAADRVRTFPVAFRSRYSLPMMGIGFAVAMSLVAVLPSGASAGSGTAADATLSSDSSAGRRKPPAPSARPETAVFDKSLSSSATAVPAGRSTESVSQAPTPPAGASGDVSTEQATRFQSIVDRWRNEHDVEGVTIALNLRGGGRWNSSSGAMDPDELIDATSVTKTFTAAMILQLVDEGKLLLDEPIPVIPEAPSLHDAGVTARQLLNHSSGLATYQESPEFKANPGMKMSPKLAIELATKQPLLWKPGANSGYSSSGFLALGFLAEHVGGSSFESQLQSRFFGPLGLSATRLNPETIDGWVGWSTAGIQSTVGDLATWGAALYREKTVLSKTSSDAMVNVDNEASVGLGAWPVCPCSTDSNGKKRYTAIGHHAGSGLLDFAPADGSVAAVFITEPIFNSRVTQQDVHDLIAQIRAAL